MAPACVSGVGKAPRHEQLRNFRRAFVESSVGPRRHPQRPGGNSDVDRNRARRGALRCPLAALPAAPASANVQVGSSGWQWGNPLPQGNTVRAMSFARRTGYAAGDFGTLLKTSDGGTTWSGLPVGTFQGLTVVQALDANTVFAGGGCVARALDRRRQRRSRRSASRRSSRPAATSCATSRSSRADVGYLLLAGRLGLHDRPTAARSSRRAPPCPSRAPRAARRPAAGSSSSTRERATRRAARADLPDARRRRLVERRRQRRARSSTTSGSRTRSTASRSAPAARSCARDDGGSTWSAQQPSPRAASRSPRSAATRARSASSRRPQARS